jgi:aspartyl-tRNA(Asn)/glutamyl-tRNA(Gln) amidotransferase subunit B
MRGKEQANDYRYFPEPDIVPVMLDDKKISDIRAALPELPDARLRRYMQEGVARADAQIITVSKALADFYESAAEECGSTRETAKWIVGEMMRNLKDRELEPEGIPCRPHKARRRRQNNRLHRQKGFRHAV